eukprot:TRINITY_DN2878_c0_g1_i2.p1 TRINITY_DN2878_c0_g1~~TRINITY_DN2878_c0_g1_i2.p1  ORF type:complete len:866 (-),score=256.85 TRINITY_DN2878_c0_g1_i2:93-2690(-)
MGYRDGEDITPFMSDMVPKYAERIEEVPINRPSEPPGASLERPMHFFPPPPVIEAPSGEPEDTPEGHSQSGDSPASPESPARFSHVPASKTQTEVQEKEVDMELVDEEEMELAENYVWNETDALAENSDTTKEFIQKALSSPQSIQEFKEEYKRRYKKELSSLELLVFRSLLETPDSKIVEDYENPGLAYREQQRRLEKLKESKKLKASKEGLTKKKGGNAKGVKGKGKVEEKVKLAGNEEKEMYDPYLVDALKKIEEAEAKGIDINPEDFFPRDPSDPLSMDKVYDEVKRDVYKALMKKSKVPKDSQKLKKKKRSLQALKKDPKSKTENSLTTKTENTLSTKKGDGLMNAKGTSISTQNGVLSFPNIEGLTKKQVTKKFGTAFVNLNVPLFIELCRNYPKELKIAGGTPLHAAVALSSIPITKQLLSVYKVDVNAVNDDRATPLHILCADNDLELLKVLVEAGANVNLADGDGVTPLLLLAQVGDVTTVEYLIRAGAEVNKSDFLGNIPLHVTASLGNVNITALLLKYNADVERLDEDGRNALHYAAEKGSVEVAKLLLKWFDQLPDGADRRAQYINQPNIKGLNPLHFAVGHGRLEMTKFLVDQGAELSPQDVSGSTPLHLACIRGETEITEYLLGKGALVDLANDEDFTPLHLACQHGKIGSVTKMLEAGANPNERTEDGTTCLQLVCDGSLIEKNETIEEVVKLLLSYHASPNMADINGNYPIILAAQLGSPTLVQGLINAGADPNSHSTSFDYPIHLALESGNWETARVLVLAGADPTVMNDQGCNALHMAAHHGNKEWCRYLVECGVKVNGMTNDGSTPLSLAMERKDEELVELLKGWGAKKIDVFSIAEDQIENESQN